LSAETTSAAALPLKKSRYNEEEIAFALKQAELGRRSKRSAGK
jgi:hypothetical protein